MLHYSDYVVPIARAIGRMCMGRMGKEEVLLFNDEIMFPNDFPMKLTLLVETEPTHSHANQTFVTRLIPS